MITIFYRNPRLLIVVLALIIVSGISALQLLPRMEDPRFANRNATIVTSFPGADASRVEALVTKVIEDELLNIQEIRKLTATSRAGVSVLLAELTDDVGFGEVDEVWSRVRDRLNDIESELPTGAGRPNFDNDKTYAATLVAGIVWDNESEISYAVLNRMALQLEEIFRSVPGTEYTELYGNPKEEVHVDISQAKLDGFGITMAQLAMQIEQSDAKVAAGRLRNKDRSLLIEVTGEVNSLTRIREILIRKGADGQSVRLGDVATVTKTIADPPDQLAIIDGKPGVVVMSRMASGNRIDLWSDAVNLKIATYKKDLAAGVKLEILHDQGIYVRDRLAVLMKNFMYAVGLVMIVVLLMMGWRSAILVGTALPLSALMVMTAMKMNDMPIHQMSVSGLIIALGLLIDNAIVIVDEVNQKLREGHKPQDAIASAVKHLFVPLMGSTVTTVLAFMPIVLMPGGAGEFVGSIAMGVIFALISSFILAMTVIPAMVGLLNGKRGGKEASDHWLAIGIRTGKLHLYYEKILQRLFRMPILAVLLAIILPVVGFGVASQLEEQFFPAADRDQFQIQIKLPAQTSIMQTYQTMSKIREAFLGEENVENVYLFAGANSPIFYYNMVGGDDQSSFYAQGMIKLKTHVGGKELINRMQAKLERAHPDADVLVLQFEQGPPAMAPVEMKIIGPDVDQLRKMGDQARRVLSTVNGIISTNTKIADGYPKLMLKLYEQEARLAGLSNTAVAKGLDDSLRGVIGGSFLESTERLDIRVRLIEKDRDDMTAMSALKLRGGVPVSSVGDFELKPELSIIVRENGRRMNPVVGHVSTDVVALEAQKQFKSKMQKLIKSREFVVPDGYELVWGGSAGERNRAVGNLMASVMILVIMMVIVLVLSFGSFRLAGVIGFVALCSVGLGLGSLWLFDMPFGFMSIVAIMGLIGVAINDSIVVLAAIQEDEKAKIGDIDAIVKVVKKSTRHVLATTATTMVGFIPLVLGGGGFWPPVAIAIAGGVGGATVLALIFIPSAYILLKCKCIVPNRRQLSTMS